MATIRAYLDINKLHTAGFRIGKHPEGLHYVEIPVAAGTAHIKMPFNVTQGLAYISIDEAFPKLPKGIAQGVVRITSVDKMALADAQRIGMQVNSRRVSRDGKCSAVVVRSDFHQGSSVITVTIVAPSVPSWTRFRNGLIFSRDVVKSFAA